MVLGHPSGAQRLPLAGTRGAEHLRAPVASELHRGRAHPAGRRVHQHRLAGPQPGEVVQSVVGGEEDDRDGGRLLERPARGIRTNLRRSATASGPKPFSSRPITRSPGPAR